MSTAKTITLVLYAILALLAVFMGGGPVGDWSLKILLILAAVHAVETVIFLGFCRRAGGSLPLHLLSVFFFGVLHVQEIRAKQSAQA